MLSRIKLHRELIIGNISFHACCAPTSTQVLRSGPPFLLSWPLIMYILWVTSSMNHCTLLYWIWNREELCMLSIFFYFKTWGVNSVILPCLFSINNISWKSLYWDLCHLFAALSKNCTCTCWTEDLNYSHVNGV